MAESIREAIAELAQSAEGLPDDPDARAEEIASLAWRQDPQGRKLESFRREAAKVVPGASAPLTGAQQTDILEEDAERRSPRGRARRARQAGGTAARKTRRARRGVGSVLRAPAAITGATTVRGLIAASFGLVVLYWLLRTATRTGGAQFLEGVVSGLRRPFEWLFSSGGVPGREGPTAEEQFSGVPAPSEASSSAASEWLPLVIKYFPSGERAKALRVIWCESRGNPDAVNPSSGASGLFQHLPRYWPQRSQAAGFGGASIFDPEANVATAAWLWSRGGWGHWPNCGKL